MNKITLILNRKKRDLWLAIGGIRISVQYNVDGIEKAEGKNYYRVLRNRKQVGMVWHVAKIEEEW